MAGRDDLGLTKTRSAGRRGGLGLPPLVTRVTSSRWVKPLVVRSSTCSLVSASHARKPSGGWLASSRYLLRRRKSLGKTTALSSREAWSGRAPPLLVRSVFQSPSLAASAASAAAARLARRSTKRVS